MNTQTLQEFQCRKKEELLAFVRQSWETSDLSQMQNYAAIAGRLAFLDETQPLRELETIFQNEEILSQFEVYLSDLFKDWWMHWAEFEGETLGNNILFLQDFHAVLASSAIPFSANLRLQFEQLINSVGTPILDTETKIVLDEFKLFYPMPDEKLLPVLREPISWAMLQIEEFFNPESEKVWEPCWNAEQQRWEIQTETGEKLVSVEWVQEQPPVFRVLDSENRSVDFITTTRIGTYPVTQNEATPELWSAETRWLSIRQEMIQENGLSMRFDDGSRAVFPVGKHSAGTITPETFSWEEFWESQLLALAADSGERTRWKFSWQSPDGGLTIRALSNDDEICFAEHQNRTGKSFSTIRIFRHELHAAEDGFWAVPLDEFLNWIFDEKNLEAVAEDGTTAQLDLTQVDSWEI